MIERIAIDCDEDGFRLILYGEVEVERSRVEDDEGVFVLRSPANLRLSQGAALQLRAEVRDKVEEWAAEADVQRANVAAGLDHEGRPLEQARKPKRLDLLPYQADELRLYADGRPRHVPQRTRVLSPTANLIRRGLLMKVGGHGDGLYAITEQGRAALVASCPVHEED